MLVLDSSHEEVCAQNRAAAASLPLDLCLERFDPAMPPFEKFWRGAEMVQTEYASLCADDDFILVASVQPIIDSLEGRPDYSVAHGWYFQFYLEASLGLTSVLYRGPSIDADNFIDRIYQLFSNYEALTYGVHRTRDLQRILFHTQDMSSMLARELLGGALAVIAGKVARLPVLYSGRSLGPSGSYANWHPIEFLARSPRGLFGEYARYKRKVFEFCSERNIEVKDPTEAERHIDLAHMRYAADYFRADVLDYVNAQVRGGRTLEDLMGGVWAVLSRRTGVEAFVHRSRPVRRLRRALFPNLRDHHLRKLLAPNSFARIPARTASGRNRDAEIYHAFQTAVDSGGVTPATAEIIAIMQGYE